MVAYQEEFYPIPLALEYHLHQYLPFGAAIFHEKNLKAKFVDLLLVLLGMLFLYFGTK